LAGRAEVSRAGTAGATVSMVQLSLTVLLLPARSVAVSTKLCAPSASGPVWYVEEHVEGAPPSRLQVSVASASASENENVVPVALLTAAGAEVSTGAVGAVVSSAQL